jgi:hypothetical protein
MIGYAVVIPTIGRPSLIPLLHALATGTGPLPDEIVVVHDRPERPLPLTKPPGPGLDGRLWVVTGPGRGPAAARNRGWRSVRSPWVVFLDDDVLPEPSWRAKLNDDLARAGGAAGVQGQVCVPLPADRRPTDWERQVAGLATAPWITADMMYRRDVLAEVGGFDERFPRAYREDTDLAYRVAVRGYRLVRGHRQAIHPVRPTGPWVSLARQCGNADDALLRRLYGPNWRRRLGLPQGRRPVHALVTGMAGLAMVSAVLGRRRLSAAAGLAWLAGTTEFAVRRIVPGPRTTDEVARMIMTSVLIPPLATVHWVRGWLRTCRTGSRMVTA